MPGPQRRQDGVGLGRRVERDDHGVGRRGAHAPHQVFERLLPRADIHQHDVRAACAPACSKKRRRAPWSPGVRPPPGTGSGCRQRLHFLPQFLGLDGQRRWSADTQRASGMGITSRRLRLPAKPGGGGRRRLRIALLGAARTLPARIARPAARAALRRLLLQAARTGRSPAPASTGTGPVTSEPRRARRLGARVLHERLRATPAPAAGWPSGMGRTSFRRHQHQQLGVVAAASTGVWKSLPSSGMSPRPGILLKVSIVRLSSRPAMAKLWPSPAPPRSARGGCQRGDGEALEDQAVGEIERADLRASPAAGWCRAA